MNIYMLSRNEDIGYDEYCAVVVIAKSPQDAIKIHPSDIDGVGSYTSNGWTTEKKNIHVEYIGKAAVNAKRGVVLASFNAG